MKITYRERNCAICQKPYRPASSVQRFCNQCAPNRTTELKKYNSWYKTKFSQEIKDTQHMYYEKIMNDAELKRKYREQHNNLRKNQRKQIQSWWGHVGGPRGTWVNRSWDKSEELALKILSTEGFLSPKRLNYFKAFPFDVRAEKDGAIHVFQVTQRTHVDGKNWHHELATDLGLKYNMLYISPDMSRYFLKSADEPNSVEITLKDLEEVKTI